MSSILDKSLSFLSKNSKTYVFKNLVENNSINDKINELSSLKSNAISAINNQKNKLSKSLYDQAKNLSNTKNKATAIAQEKINELSAAKDNAIATAKSNLNRLDQEFQSKISELSAVRDNVVSSAKNNISQLGQELYDKAKSLPEAKNVNLKLLSDTSSHMYGTFKGGSVYKTFTGEIDSNNKNTSKQEGWIILDSSSSNYCLFKNGDKSYITAIKDIEPKSIVEDFTPLYDNLANNQYNKDDSIFKDVVNQQSRMNEIAEVAGNTGAIDLYNKAVHEKNDLRPLNNYIEKYPQQIVGSRSNTIKNDSVYNSIQAVIYDLPNYINDNNGDNITSSVDQLFCFQQPESISYTAAAGFDSVQPRGTQQPFKFYTNAEAMSLSFTLKWHYDEVLTLSRDSDKGQSGTVITLQDIAKIAEDFTRPWETNNSISPKVCKVVLPGVSEVGYITQAQISYSGDMAGYNSGSGVMTETNSQTTFRQTTDYFYNRLEITFELAIIKDITLHQLASNPGIKMFVNDVEPLNGDSNGIKKLAENVEDATQANADGFIFDEVEEAAAYNDFLAESEKEFIEEFDDFGFVFDEVEEAIAYINYVADADKEYIEEFDDFGFVFDEVEEAIAQK